jgi:hypothetical protein
MEEIVTLTQQYEESLALKHVRMVAEAALKSSRA